LQRPKDFYSRFISVAKQAEDNQTVVDAYLDILDYKHEANSVFESTIDSMSYTENIDHALLGHLKDHMAERGLDSRLHQAVYFFNINGGLTSADLINELANDSKVTMLPNSKQVKDEMIAHLSPDSETDNYIKQKVIAALKACQAKFDADFYELESLFVEEKEPEIEVENENM
jgi:hypothetical protein